MNEARLLVDSDEILYIKLSCDGTRIVKKQGCILFFASVITTSGRLKIKQEFTHVFAAIPGDRENFETIRPVLEMLNDALKSDILRSMDSAVRLVFCADLVMLAATLGIKAPDEGSSVCIWCDRTKGELKGGMTGPGNPRRCPGTVGELGVIGDTPLLFFGELGIAVVIDALHLTTNITNQFISHATGKFSNATNAAGIGKKFISAMKTHGIHSDFVLPTASSSKATDTGVKKEKKRITQLDGKKCRKAFKTAFSWDTDVFGNQYGKDLQALWIEIGKYLDDIYGDVGALPDSANVIKLWRQIFGDQATGWYVHHLQHADEHASVLQSFDLRLAFFSQEDQERKMSQWKFARRSRTQNGGGRYLLRVPGLKIAESRVKPLFELIRLDRRKLVYKEHKV